MSVTAAVSVWDKINAWMSPLDGLLDSILRPVVAPLADMLDCVTGDSETVKSTAQRWRDLAATVRQLEQHHRDVIAPLASSWSGEASDAFQGTMTELLTQVEELAKGCAETAEFLDDAAMEVKTAEDMVAAIIQELIEWALLSLAVSLALSFVTWGASALAGAAAAAAEAAVAGSRIAAILARVAQLLTKLAEFLKAVNAMSAFSREGFFIKTLLVKGMILKPIVSNITGLDGKPISGAVDALLKGGRDIVADEIDDQLSGQTGMQTPLRDGIDDVVAPVADAAKPWLDRLKPVTDALEEVDGVLPKAPFQD